MTPWIALTLAVSFVALVVVLAWRSMGELPEHGWTPWEAETYDRDDE